MIRNLVAMGLLLAGWLMGAEAGSAAAPFVIRDFLQRRWVNELVHFPLGEQERQLAAAGRALVGPDGQPVPYQVVGDRIVFAASLEPFETRSYRFGDAAAVTVTDLRIEETAEAIRLINAQTGIALRKSIGDGTGPIEAVRLGSGTWIGGSRLETKQPLTSWTAELTARGPVVAEVVCRAQFANKFEWRGVFRLQAGESVVLVDEQFDLGDSSRLEVSLGTGFAPSHLLWRNGSAVVTGEPVGGTGSDPVFKLQPWALWGPPRQGKWCGFYSETGADLLMLGSRNGDVWVDLRRPREAGVPIVRVGDDLILQLPMERGERRWMIGAFPREASLAEKGKVTTPLPQEAVIRYEFPLDRVKDYVLSWPETEDHPRVYVTGREVAKLRERFKADPAELARLSKAPIVIYDLDPHIVNYLATGDSALEQRLIDTAIQWLQEAVDMQVRQTGIGWFGRAPHGQTNILTSLSVADAVIASAAVTPEQRERMRAQAAFLGYTVMRPDYWSPMRGFGANPNMTSHVASYQVIVGCFVASHPQARAWVEEGLRELKDVELDTWSDENGGWIEAPGYAMVSLNYILGGFLAARNSGYADHVNDMRLKRLYGWLAKMSTPPDARLLNTRCIPAIGNTWKLAWCGEFGLAAALWKDADPAFAAEMAWMHRQHNSYTRKVGGFCATLAGYRDWLTEPVTEIEPVAPAYGSELFPESGVVLRSHFPSNRETMLYQIAGENCHHYDYDSGSITFWGKGRVIADEFGYTGRATAADHSMVETPIFNNAIMRVREFTTTPALDYVRSSLAKNPPGDELRLTPLIHLDYQYDVYSDWIRQIAFVKDADPLGPNYIVINDSLRTPVPATWRMWFTCEKVNVTPQGATAIGKEDVDTDVYFAQPSPVKLATEEKTRATSGYNTEAKYGRWDWTQTGLIATVDSGLGFTAVVYPRLKTEAPPVCTTLANGQGVKIATPSGTDYVFLGAKPFRHADADIEFEGTCGSVQLRGDQVILSLGAAGRIAARGQSLEASQAASRQAPAK